MNYLLRFYVIHSLSSDVSLAKMLNGLGPRCRKHLSSWAPTSPCPNLPAQLQTLVRIMKLSMKHVYISFFAGRVKTGAIRSDCAPLLFANNKVGFYCFLWRGQMTDPKTQMVLFASYKIRLCCAKAQADPKT